jgi:hypothetical protein
MPLLRPEELIADAPAYRLFELGRDFAPWRVEEVITNGPFTKDRDKAAVAWRTASRGYYAEQAGLVAAATLVAQTDDAALRFSLATATSDEARHADAFYQYARMVGGEPEECQNLLEPLDHGLTQLPYMGKALVHTMLEGFAADEFIILSQLFADDVLGQLYRLVRQDEIRHVAIGLNYLARESRSPRGRDAWHEFGSQWIDAGIGLIGLEAVCTSLGALTGQDGVVLHQWFLRRHRVRLRAAGVEIPREVITHDD